MSLFQKVLNLCQFEIPAKVLWAHELHGLAGDAVGQGPHQQAAALLLPFHHGGHLHGQAGQSHPVQNGEKISKAFKLLAVVR